MREILIVFVVIVGMNLLPAFAPPTWTVLAYFALTLGISDPLLIAIGVLAASLGAGGWQVYFGVIETSCQILMLEIWKMQPLT